MLGMAGQLAGHGVSWAKQVAGGASIGQVLTTETLFWAAFNIASETLTPYATNLTGTSIAGIVGPAAVQVGVLNMYDSDTRRVISQVSSGSVTAIADSPFLTGTLGSVIAKSYA